MSHPPQPVRGYPCTGPCSPESPICGSLTDGETWVRHTRHIVRAAAKQNKKSQCKHVTMQTGLPVFESRKTEDCLRHCIHKDPVTHHASCYLARTLYQCFCTQFRHAAQAERDNRLYGPNTPPHTPHPIPRVPWHLALPVKRPRRETGHSPPSSKDYECVELYLNFPMSCRTQHRFALTRIITHLPALFLRQHKVNFGKDIKCDTAINGDHNAGHKNTGQFMETKGRHLSS